MLFRPAITTMLALFITTQANAVTPKKPASVPPNAGDSVVYLLTTDELLREVRARLQKRQRPVVVLSLDATLLDSRPRMLKVLQDYADKELMKVRPEDARKIKSLTLAQVQPVVADTLGAAGVTDPGVVNNAAVFWSERFFSDDYLQYDVATDGSAEFVRTLYTNGARIVYVSDRNAPQHLLGTVKSIRDRGFPIGVHGTELIMKPTTATADAVFHQQTIDYLTQTGGILAFIGNEPAHANLFRRAFADASVFAYRSSTRPNPPALLPNVTPLAGF